MTVKIIKSTFPGVEVLWKFFTPGNYGIFCSELLTVFIIIE